MDLQGSENTTLRPRTTPTTMDTSPLEEFAVEFAITLAGLQEQDPEVEPLNPNQLVVSIYAAVAAHARTRADYDTETDITSVLQIGVSAYAQAIYAAAAALVGDLDPTDPEHIEAAEAYLEGLNLADGEDRS